MLTNLGQDGRWCAILAEVRAAGLQCDELPEVIEILDDDTDAFGERARGDTLEDTGGPKWVGPVAVLALVGLIAFGVASSSSSDGTPHAAPVTTTSAVPQTTQPAPTSTLPPEPPVPYYSADPPRQYAVQYAEIQTDPHVFYGGDSYQLWATEGATATSGSWVSIDSWSGGGFGSVWNAYRVLAGDRQIAISHAAAGQSSAQFSTSAGVSVTLGSYGRSDDELVQLAASVTETNGHVEFGDPALLTGLRMLTSVPPGLAIQGVTREQVNYVYTDDPSRTFTIDVSQYPPTSDDGAGGPADREIALRFFFDHLTPFTADGHAAVAGTVPGSSDYVSATWIAGDHTVTVSGNMPEQQLIAIARTVHEVSSSEWQGMQFQAARNATPATNGANDYKEELAQTVSFATDSAGNPWTVRVANASFGNQRLLAWKWGADGVQETPSDSAQISTAVDSQRTWVVADLPRAVAATAELHVSRVGLDPVVVPFIDLGPTFDRTFAAYAFSEPGPYTAQIVAPDGTVLASWPSS